MACAAACPVRARRAQWYARPAPTEASARSGLDGHGRRIVRLTSMVWAMQAHGAFEQGRLARDVAVPCAIEALYQARLMRELVDHERKRCELGARITSFVDEIENLASDVRTRSAWPCAS